MHQSGKASAFILDAFLFAGLSVPGYPGGSDQGYEQAS